MAEGIKIGSAFIEINADIKEAEGDVNRLRRNVNGSAATLNVHADTLIANGQIAVAARSRFVDLNLRVNGLAAVGKSLAALSGAAAVGKILGNVGGKLADIPANLPKIAMVSTSIFAIGAAGLAATSGTIALAGGLASVAGAGLALPGLMAGFAVGAGVMIAALKDAPTVLADLGPAFSGLQDSISANFWDKAAQPIRDLTNSLLPSLSSGLGQVATDLGGAFATASTALQSALGGGVLDGMMASLSSSIQIVTGALTPLVQAFTTVGAIGAAYLPQLATWFVTISEKFNSFIQGAAADGSLKGWIDTGIGALKSLGDVVGSVASIFKGLYTAASSAGGAPIQLLADGLGKVATVVNSPAFQGALTTIFSGAASAMAGLSGALGPIGNMFVALAPTIANVMTIAGQLAGQVLGGLAKALSQPAFATGLTSFFEGIQTGMAAILPHLPTLGSLFGTLMGVVGKLAAVIGPVLGQAIKVLAPAFTTILTAITPLIPMLGSSLMTIVTGLTPLISMLAGVFAQLMPVIMQLIPPIMSVITTLLPPLMALFASLVPVIMTVVSAVAPLVTMLAAALIPTINMLMPVVQTVFGVISSVITSVMGIVQGVIEVAMGLISGNWDQVWSGMQKVLSGIWNTIVTAIRGAWTLIKTLISAGLTAANTVIRTIFGGISSFISGVWRNIVKFISDAFVNAKNFVSGGVESIKNFIRTGFDNAVNLVKTAFTNISNGVRDGIKTAVDFVTGLPGKITTAIGDLSSTLLGAGGDIIEGFLSGLKDGFEGVKNFVGGIADWIAKNKGPKPYDLALLVPNGGWIMKGLGNGIKKGIPGLQKTLGAVAQSVASGMGQMTTDVMVQSKGAVPTGLSAGIKRNSVVSSAEATSSRGLASNVSTVNNQNTTQNITVNIEAKSMKEMQDVVDLFKNISQTARTGRGTQNVRIA